MEVENFIWKFHAVDGENLVEKQKNFNSLLTNIPPDHDALIGSITPQNPLQELFKLKLLLKLRRLPELVEILKSDEEYLPAKLLKNKWFCQQLAVMLEQNSSGFVNYLLPFTSYIIRKRIIAKLAIYGTKLDTLYNEIYSRYGSHIAKDLLTGCSSIKIENIFQNHQVKLSPHQQQILYQKHPSLFIMYAKQKQSNIDNSLVHCIAQRDIYNFFRVMLDTNNIKGCLGKRLTRKLLLNYKELIIANADKFDGVLHSKTVIRILRLEELKQFFYNCCPKDVNNFRHDGSVSNSFRENLGSRLYIFLFEIFQKKYNRCLYDFPDLVNEKMMETMNLEEREKWITIKKKNGMSASDLIPYKKTTESVPLIKSKINRTSSTDRRDGLIKLLLKTCQINNDLNALAEICEYVYTNNDSHRIVLNFLGRLQLLIPLEKFDERHWNSVILMLNKEDDDPYTYWNREYYFKYMEYFCLRRPYYFKYLEYLYYKKDLSNERILNILKFIKAELWDFFYDISNTELQKILLLKFIDLMPTLIEANEKLEHEDLKLMAVLIQWNKRHPKDKIQIFTNTRLLESFKKATQEAIQTNMSTPAMTSLLSIFENIICTKEQSNFRDDSVNNYFLLNFPYCNAKTDRWLLKHQPNTIAQHFNKFVEHTLTSSIVDFTFLHYVKKFTDPSFQEKLIKYCLETLIKESINQSLLEMFAQDQNLKVAFRVLAALEPPNEFLKHIAPFFPHFNKFKEMKEHREKINCAIAIVESFKYANNVMVLPALISYCKGDFLGYAMESLYFLFYHLPENQLSVFINDLSSKSASIRKYSIFLTYIVGSVDEVQRLLQHFMENERSVSVQKHLFRAALRYFIKNSSDEFWECVKVCMTKLDRNDRENIDILVKIHQIPQKFQARHVMFVWEILKKGEDVDKNRRRLLSSIPSSAFKDFPLSFLLEIISENFLKAESNCESAINKFVISSLTESNSKNEIMNIIFNIMKQENISQCTSWKQKKRAQEMLSCFVDALVSGLGTKVEYYEILCMFSREWHNLFSATETMKEHLKLTFAQFYLESNKDLMKFSAVIAEFLENLVSVYGNVVVDVFATELGNFLRKILCCYGELNEEFLKFLLHLLKNWNNLIFYLLVIKLLPSEQPSQKQTNELFNQIIELLRQVPQDSVQMSMNLYLRDLE